MRVATSRSRTKPTVTLLASWHTNGLGMVELLEVASRSNQISRRDMLQLCSTRFSSAYSYVQLCLCFLCPASGHASSCCQWFGKCPAALSPLGGTAKRSCRRTLRMLFMEVLSWTTSQNPVQLIALHKGNSSPTRPHQPAPTKSLLRF